MTTTPPAESRILIISAGANLVIGIIGLVFAAISSSQAILLDGLFNIVYFGTALFTLKVARLVQRADDERFPYGYAYFEPLVNGLKGVLVLGVSLMALAGAIESLVGGGRSIAAGAAIAYGTFATIAGWALAVVTARGARRTASPLVQADAKNWIVNGAVSSCVLIAFAAIVLIRGTALDFLVPYVDPIVVVTLVVITIGVPVRMAWQALMELLGRTPPAAVVDEVRGLVEAATADLPVRDLSVRVTQPGRTRQVLVHVVLPEDAPLDGLRALDDVRARVAERLQAAHAATILDVVFTTRPEWGLSLSAATKR